MSVLIKNMEMPESCYRCPMANDDFYLCGATEKYLENDSEDRRPDWCPLIEVETVDQEELIMPLNRKRVPKMENSSVTRGLPGSCWNSREMVMSGVTKWYRKKDHRKMTRAVI